MPEGAAGLFLTRLMLFSIFVYVVVEDFESIGTAIKDQQAVLMKKFESIVGLESLKDSLKTYMQDMLIDKFRRELGAVQGFKRPVFFFLGNPGTGKTSVASLVAGTVFHNKTF
jgi:replication-associated recombination protein RarA